MTHQAVRNKHNGKRFERDIVGMLKRAGIEAHRTWGSTGISEGKSAYVDIVSEVGDFQCKRKKKVADWMSIPHDLRGIIYLGGERVGIGNSCVILRLTDFLTLLSQLQNSLSQIQVGLQHADKSTAPSVPSPNRKGEDG